MTEKNLKFQVGDLVTWSPNHSLYKNRIMHYGREPFEITEVRRVNHFWRYYTSSKKIQCFSEDSYISESLCVLKRLKNV
jgi:hypothetical protein